MLRHLPSFLISKPLLPIPFTRSLTSSNNISISRIPPTHSISPVTMSTQPKPANYPADYEPAKVWTDPTEMGGTMSSMNKPTAGARSETELPIGEHPLQLYSLGTPNGVKVTILLEELLAAGVTSAEYDAHIINIMKLDQFGSGFVNINPNSKIPAMVDRSMEPPIPIFESGAILLYLAEKFDKFIPTDPVAKAQCLSWLFWQVGSAPYVGGGFGHFYGYAPFKIQYAIDRFTMETKRQLDVLDKHLEGRDYICDFGYSIADIAIYPWYGLVMFGDLYDAAEFLQVQSYKNVMKWAKRIEKRPAVKRGSIVNKSWGPPEKQLPERHSASDFEGKMVE